MKSTHLGLISISDHSVDTSICTVYKEECEIFQQWKLIRFLDGSMKYIEQAANVFGFISEIFIIIGQTMLNYI